MQNYSSKIKSSSLPEPPEVEVFAMRFERRYNPDLPLPEVPYSLPGARSTMRFCVR